jgi:RNA polymerase sigma factor (sigma-70 family)
VQRAIHQLPERPRLAVILRRFQDLSSAEIAEALDLSESAIKVCAHRGDEKLRVLLRTAWEKM